MAKNAKAPAKAGAKTKPPEQARAVVNDPPRRAKNGKMGTGLKIAVVAGVLLIVLVGAILLGARTATKGAAEAADNFLNAVQAKNAPEAYAMFSKQAKDQTPEDQFAVAIGRIGPILNAEENRTSVDVSGGSNGTVGEVKYVLVGGDGNTYNITIQLVKEDGVWKVQNFKSQSGQNQNQ